jgi:hypothetical protein
LHPEHGCDPRQHTAHLSVSAVIIRSQLVALEAKYAAERRCDAARKLLDLCHQKRDELAMVLRCAAALLNPSPVSNQQRSS